MSKIICSHCGSTNVLCEAMINPNTKQFDHYTDESFKYGCCESCDKNFPLVDVGSNFSEYHTLWREARETPLADKPNCAMCLIVWKDSCHIQEALIKLNSQVDEEKDDKIFFYCNSESSFLSLCDFGGEDFIVWSVQELINI